MNKVFARLCLRSPLPWTVATDTAARLFAGAYPDEYLGGHIAACGLTPDRYFRHGLLHFNDEKPRLLQFVTRRDIWLYMRVLDDAVVGLGLPPMESRFGRWLRSRSARLRALFSSVFSSAYPKIEYGYLSPPAGIVAQLPTIEPEHDRSPDPFYIDPKTVPAGLSYEWKRFALLGKEDQNYYRGMAAVGWKPVPPSRHKHFPKRGHRIIVNGMILMQRPKKLTDAAHLRAFEQSMTALTVAMHVTPPDAMSLHRSDED